MGTQEAQIADKEPESTHSESDDDAIIESDDGEFKSGRKRRRFGRTKSMPKKRIKSGSSKPSGLEESNINPFAFGAGSSGFGNQQMMMLMQQMMNF